MAIFNSPGDPLDIEYLNGRHYNDTHPAAGMDLRAYYDLDADLITQKISDLSNTFINWSAVTTPYDPISNPTGIGYWWGANQLQNVYRTDQQDYYGAISGIGASPTSAIKTQTIFKSHTSPVGQVEYLRSTLDGATVDFTLSDYAVANQNTNIKSLAQLNDSVGNDHFEFNAILVYYDVYDPVNPDDVATNLYGIYFLNKVVQNGSNHIIPIITKEKPDAVNKIQGNAFAFKVNLKFDTSIEDVTVEKSVNDYATFGLDLFLDVLTEFRTLQTKYNDKIAELTTLAFDVEAAKQALTNTSALDALATRVAQLETTVAASTAAFNESASIMNLITSLTRQIDDIYNNRTSLSLSYQLEAFRKGYGISLDKHVPGVMTIGLDAYSYSDTSQTDLSSTLVNISNVNTLKLGASNTYYKHYKSVSIGNLNPVDWVLPANQEIRIDDSTYGWKKGKTFKLIIDSRINTNTFSIKIKTDANNTSNGSAPYSKTIATLNAADFPTTYARTGRPIIEITCTDAVNFTFQVDKIIR